MGVEFPPDGKVRAYGCQAFWDKPPSFFCGYFVLLKIILCSHLECPLSEFLCIQVLRFAPPMCITEDDVKFSISVIRRALDEYVDK